MNEFIEELNALNEVIWSIECELEVNLGWCFDEGERSMK